MDFRWLSVRSGAHGGKVCVAATHQPKSATVADFGHADGPRISVLGAQSRLIACVFHSSRQIGLEQPTKNEFISKVLLMLSERRAGCAQPLSRTKWKKMVFMLSE